MSFNPEGFFPSGHLPDGFFPGASSGYPSIAASRRISLPSGGLWIVDPDVENYCEIDWSGVLPSGRTLASVAYALPSGLTNEGEAIDTVNGKSALLVDGTRHGAMYAIQVVATLSDDSTIPFSAPLRCFNG